MDIYILRDGNEVGPLSEETVQTLLKQGSVLVSDLAWRPGMPQWIPLVNVLYPAAAPVTPPAETAVPVPTSTGSEEPASSKQKAFLGFLGIPFEAGLSKGQAAVLVNDAMENPKLHARVNQWNQDRFKLHPDLFAEEIQAKKDDRASHYFEICQSEGAEVFTKVSKAHCQVLVGFLDVRFPNWDARESEATWNYFFPAVAEKFPQLVQKAWRGKLHYPEGPKVAPELARRSGGVRKGEKKGELPVGRLVAAVVVLGAFLFVVYSIIFGPVKKTEVAGEASKVPAPAKISPASPLPTPPLLASSNPAPSQVQPVALVTSQPSESAQPAAREEPSEPPSMSAEAPAAPAPAAPVSAAPAQVAPSAPTPAAPAPVVDSAAPFDPFAPANSTTASGSAPLAAPLNVTPHPAAPAPAPAPASAPQNAGGRQFVVLKKPVDIQLPFGSVKAPAGTAMKFISSDGANLKVLYANTEVSIPIALTDYTEAAPPSGFSSSAPVAAKPASPSAATPTPQALDSSAPDPNIF